MNLDEIDPRAARLVRDLDLEPHPEGGYFREIFRSRREVDPLDGRPPRSSLTSMYFLLCAGQYSRWHRIDSDEIWSFHEGEAVELYWIDAGGTVHAETLGRLDGMARPLHVVPGGCWQAARPKGDYALVGCTVGPGFDYADFEMIDASSDDWAQLQAIENLPGGLI